MKLRAVNDQAGHVIWCQGCEGYHIIPPTWQFNGDLEKPTFTPSLLIRYEYGEERKQVVCHSLIRDGRIQFLDDCTHALAGQTVDLEECDW